MKTDPNQHVVVGHVVGVFGVKGWVRIRSETQPSANILDYSPWYIQQHGQWTEYRLLEGQLHSKGVIARLEGIADRDQAAMLAGCPIAVLRSQLPEPAEGEYYWTDLVGLAVYNQQGEHLGRVASLMETGANDVLVVRDAEHEYLIPYVTGIYVMQVDLAGERIEVDWQRDY